MKLHIKLPDKHTLVAKGEHFFHGAYTGAESVLGHGPLAHIATCAFLFIVLDLVLHFTEHNA